MKKLKILIAIISISILLTGCSKLVKADINNQSIETYFTRQQGNLNKELILK